MNAVFDDALAPQAQIQRRRSSRSLIALVLVAIVLLAPVGLRWFATAPPENTLATPSAPAVDPEPDRPLALPQQTSAAEPAGAAVTPLPALPDRATADVPPQATAPGPLAAPAGGPVQAEPAAAVQAPAPPAALPPALRTREIRETISPPSTACTSNMAALGFCTLPPASAKE